MEFSDLTRKLLCGMIYSFPSTQHEFQDPKGSNVPLFTLLSTHHQREVIRGLAQALLFLDVNIKEHCRPSLMTKSFLLALFHVLFVKIQEEIKLEAKRENELKCHIIENRMIPMTKGKYEKSELDILVKRKYCNKIKQKKECRCFFWRSLAVEFLKDKDTINSVEIPRINRSFFISQDRNIWRYLVLMGIGRVFLTNLSIITKNPAFCEDYPGDCEFLYPKMKYPKFNDSQTVKEAINGRNSFILGQVKSISEAFEKRWDWQLEKNRSFIFETELDKFILDDENLVILKKVEASCEKPSIKFEEIEDPKVERIKKMKGFLKKIKKKKKKRVKFVDAEKTRK